MATSSMDTTISSVQMHSAVRCMDDETVRSLLKRIAALGVNITRRPETGLIMMNVSDCFKTDFHLGEVLTTSAEIQLEGIRGWGMIMGDDGDRALLLAGLDALSRCRESDLYLEIKKQLNQWLKKAETQLGEERKLSAATRVNFESMVTE